MLKLEMLTEHFAMVTSNNEQSIVKKTSLLKLRE
jgi:hypothetical protein